MDSPPHSSWSGPPAPDALAEARVHEELRAIAHAVLKCRPCPGLLQTTALVHEAWMRLRGFDLTRWDSRSSQFAALAAKTLRSVLVDEARREHRDKRGGDWQRIQLSPQNLPAGELPAAVDLLGLDEAMNALAQLSPRRASVVELRFFGGLTIPQVADLLGVSERTIETDWELARAWLRVKLDEAAGERTGRPDLGGNGK